MPHETVPISNLRADLTAVLYGREDRDEEARFTEQQVAQALARPSRARRPPRSAQARVSEATFYAWKKAYAGWGSPSRARAPAEDENRRLKQVVADLTLDKQMLQECCKKSLRPGRRRAIAHELLGAYRVARAGLLGGRLHRATSITGSGAGVAPLRMRFGSCGARRASVIGACTSCCAGRAGGSMRRRRNRSPRGGARVRVKRVTKRAVTLRVARARPSRPNEQSCMDFMADRLEDEPADPAVTVEDVFTRECLAGRSMWL